MNAQVTKLPSLSLFYPAYNEAGNIAEAIKQALLILPSIAYKFEIIVIDDGSTDATYQIAQRFSQMYPEVRVVTQKNQGYGGALKRGFSESKYDWIFFTDGDLQFDLWELQKFISKTYQYDMVLGYRKNRVEGLKRDFLAKALKAWAVILFNFPLNIKDIDCAYKLIHKNVIKSISPLFSDGAMISTELITKAVRQKFSYSQIGVSHYQRFAGEATGNNPNVIFKAILDSFALQIVLVKELAQKQTNLILPSRS